MGTTTLTARIPGITPAVWTIQVVAGEIGVEPSRVGLLVGQRTTLAALLLDQAGHWWADPGGPLELGSAGCGYRPR